jgi:chromosome segregation ATPase
MESENLRNSNLKNMTALMQADENPLKSENETLAASVDTLKKEVAEKAVTVEGLERKLLASDRLMTHNKNLLDELNDENNTLKTAASDWERKYQKLEDSNGAMQKDYGKAFKLVADTGLELEPKKKEIKERECALADMATGFIVLGRKYEALEKRFEEVQKKGSDEHQQLISTLRDEANAKDQEIGQLKAENTNLLGKQTPRESDVTKLQSELVKVQDGLTEQHREMLVKLRTMPSS